MKKISISDLFETEDIFKGIRQSATDTIETLNKVQSELMNSAKIIKNDIKNSSTDSAKGLKEFTNAASAASKIMKDSAIVAKQLAQAEQQKIKVDQELVKLERLKAQETARAAKEAEKAAKLAANESSAYAKLSAELNKARKAYKDLAVTNQTNTQEAQDLLQTITKLDQQLKEVDATVGQHQRNVGNYEGAAANLKKELRDLTRELQNMSTTDPRFQEMTQRAGELKDQISDTNAVIKATAGTGIENLAGSIGTLGQVGTAAFQGVEASMALMGVESENVSKTIMRMTALLNLSEAFKALGGIGDSITQIRAGFVAFGSKAIGAFQGMTTASKAFAVTGIGLLITLIGVLIANFDKLGSVFTASTYKAKQFEQSTREQAETARNAIENFAEYERTLKRLGNTEDEIQEKRRKKFKKAIEDTKAEIEASKAVYKEQLKNLETVKTFDKLGLNWTGRALFGDEEEAKSQRKRVTELRGTLEKLKNDEFEFEKSIKDAKKAKQEEIKKENEERLKAAREAAQQELQQLNEYFKQARADTASRLRSDQENEEFAVNEKFKSQIALAKKYGKDTSALELEWMNAINDIRLKYQQEQYDKDKEDAERKLQLQKETNERLLSEMKSFEKRIADSEKQIRDGETDLMDEGVDKQKKIRENAYKDEMTALQNQLDEGQVTREEYDKLTMLGAKKLKKDLAAIDDDESKKIAAKEQEAIKKQWETMEDFAQKTTDFFVQKSNERIAQLDKEIEAAEKQSETLKTLAAEGNINAQQSLAEQERIIAESNLRKQQEQRKQQRLQLANSVFSTYASKVEAGSKNALAETIRDTTLLQAFINSIPAFYDGTEDTGSGGGLDGKGGFHAILHPHERVIPQSLNEKIGSLSNEQLTRIAQEYQNGKMVKSDVAHSSMELAILVNEMKDLKEIIRNKPETNIELGQITQSSMEIVERTRKGNTTVYNRFKVRS